MAAEDSIFPLVRKYIDEKLARGESVVVDWLTHEIIASRSGIEGDDTEFYRVCAFVHVKDVVKRCVRKFDAKPITDEQLVLDGFEHLQVAYTVPRNGRTELVPVDQLSDAELEGRAAEYEAMALGCRAHAREIRSFIATRRPIETQGQSASANETAA